MRPLRLAALVLALALTAAPDPERHATAVEATIQEAIQEAIQPDGRSDEVL